MFIFDEAFGDQDAEGRAALISALNILADRVEQVIAVTHDPELLGMTDQVISLEKVDGSTRINELVECHFPLEVLQTSARRAQDTDTRGDLEGRSVNRGNHRLPAGQLTHRRAP